MDKRTRYPFSNNRVFIKTMQNNQELCRKLVERILGFKIEEVLSITVEDTMAAINNKAPSLDLVLRTPDKVIDVELQCTSVPVLGRRMRYYQAMADIRSLPKDKAKNYDRLPDIYVIFLCTVDILKAGLPMYHFQMTCKEDARVGLEDGMHFIVANASAFKSCEDEKMRMLLQYLKTDVPDRRDELTMEIAEAVERAHQDEIIFEGFMDAESDMHVRERHWKAEGEAIGFERGTAEGEAIGFERGAAEGEAIGFERGAAEGASAEQSREQRLVETMNAQGLSMEEQYAILTDPDRKSVYERFGIN